MNATEHLTPGGHDHFVTTRWTVVRTAGLGGSGESERALSELCQMYWYPLYAYVRRRGYSREDAEDLTQSFFAQLLSGADLAGLDAERGRFRGWLLASMKHYLANAWDRANRQKRGGGVPALSLDWANAEGRYGMDPADPGNPDRMFEKEWALALLERVMGRLRVECAGGGRGELFEKAKGFLAMGGDAIPYADAARQLGMGEGALRVAVHRLRKRYRELLREEIAETVSGPSEVEEELRSLRRALAS